MKTVEEIYREMAAAFAEATGTEVAGSGDLAARLYAVAAQIYAMYVQAQWVERQCFPQTAEGEDLDRHAALRGLERREAAKAEGSIQFSVDTASATDRPIPAGTVCMTAGLVRFETVEEGTLPAGEFTTLVRARAVEAGAAGNAAAGTILSLAVAPVGVSRCVNPEGFSGGTDRESDEALRERVLDSFKRMPNGANAAFYEQGALSFEGVAAAVAVPRPRGRGTVDVVVSAPSGTPSAELLAELTDYFEARREIAVDLVVRAPEIRTVDVVVRVAVAPGADPTAVLEAAEQALRSWFNGGRLGQPVLRARLGALLYGVDGVENYAVVTPAADVAAADDVLPVLGTLTVEEMA